MKQFLVLYVGCEVCFLKEKIMRYKLFYIPIFIVFKHRHYDRGCNRLCVLLSVVALHERMRLNSARKWDNQFIEYGTTFTLRTVFFLPAAYETFKCHCSVLLLLFVTVVISFTVLSAVVMQHCFFCTFRARSLTVSFFVPMVEGRLRDRHFNLIDT